MTSRCLRFFSVFSILLQSCSTNYHFFVNHPDFRNSQICYTFLESSENLLTIQPFYKNKANKEIIPVERINVFFPEKLVIKATKQTLCEKDDLGLDPESQNGPGILKSKLPLILGTYFKRMNYVKKVDVYQVTEQKEEQSIKVMAALSDFQQRYVQISENYKGLVIYEKGTPSSKISVQPLALNEFLVDGVAVGLYPLYRWETEFLGEQRVCRPNERGKTIYCELDLIVCLSIKTNSETNIVFYPTLKKLSTEEIIGFLDKDLVYDKKGNFKVHVFSPKSIVFKPEEKCFSEKEFWSMFLKNELLNPDEAIYFPRFLKEVVQEIYPPNFEMELKKEQGHIVVGLHYGETKTEIPTLMPDHLSIESNHSNNEIVSQSQFSIGVSINKVRPVALSEKILIEPLLVFLLSSLN